MSLPPDRIGRGGGGGRLGDLWITLWITVYLMFTK
jgi:hypothetical protein